MKGPVKIWNEGHQAVVALLQRGLEMQAEPGAPAQATIREAVAGFANLTGSHRHYLARNFGGERKRDCATAHYALLLRHFTRDALLTLIGGNVPFWSFASEGVSLTMELRLEHWVAREGELTLEIFVDSKMLYLLSFTFVPAAPFGLEGELVALLSRVQGRPGEFEEIRAATKAMSEVAPRAALFAALAGLAKAAGVRHVVGVAAENHIGLVPERRESLIRQYDDFFLTLGGTPLADGFFAIDTEAEPKPVTAQKTGHRVRTRKKREFRAQVAQSAVDLWASFRRPEDEASAA